MRGHGDAPLTVGLLLHLTAETQIYCDVHGDHPPAIVLGAEPADCVISTAGIETEPVDLVAAERLLAAATAYRNRILLQVGSTTVGLSLG